MPGHMGCRSGGCLHASTREQMRSKGGLLCPRAVRPAPPAVAGLVASTFSNPAQQQAAQQQQGQAAAEGRPAPPPSSLLTHVDRTQLARLYAGQLEFGYFTTSIGARCRQRGLELGKTSAVLVEFAASLPKEELRWAKAGPAPGARAEGGAGWGILCAPLKPWSSRVACWGGNPLLCPCLLPSPGG